MIFDPLHFLPLIEQKVAEAIAIPSERLGQRESRRVAGVLRIFSYQRDGQFTSGTEKGLARYIRTV